MHSLFKPFTYSLTTRLITAFILAIVVTTILAGIPSYLILRNEIQNQTISHLNDGKNVTRTLLEAEGTRLENIANLAAERPSLKGLLLNNDQAGLSNYLNEFKNGAGLDILFLSGSSGEYLAGDDYDHSCVLTLPIGAAAFYSPSCIETQIYILTTQRIATDSSDTFYITVGLLIDNDFAAELARTTGLDQIFIVDEVITASSISELVGEHVSPEITSLDLSGDEEINSKPFNGKYYYTSYQPLTKKNDQFFIVNEVALQVEGLRTTNQRVLLFLILSTVVIALGGSILGILFARNLIAPLNNLTSAARNISDGDLSSPIKIPQEPYEIKTLAAAFEESRSNTRQYMDELSNAKAWSETVIQSIEEGIVTFNDQLTITSFNRSAQKITGWLSKEANGRRLDEILRLHEGDGLFSEKIPTIGGKTQIEVLTRTGRKANFEVTVAQLAPTSGDDFQTALVMRDITEEEATKNLQSYFLANISHEFRTPLSALNASVELMLDELDRLSKSEINELLNSIHRSVTGLQTLIDNLLESTRIQAGQHQINRQPVEFGDVVLDAMQVMKPLLERRRQVLKLKNSEANLIVFIDPTRMTQVLVNLLSNASKYSPMDSTIELIAYRPDERSLQVLVADRGIGISPTDKDNIFRRFVRLSDQDGAQYGIGLGLSVVKAIVEEHQGEVGVKDNPGGGSIFWFKIPLDGRNGNEK